MSEIVISAVVAYAIGRMFQAWVRAGLALDASLRKEGGR